MNAYSLSRLFIAPAHLPRDTVIRSSAAGSRGGKKRRRQQPKTTRYRFISTICYGHGEAICPGMIDRRTIRVLTTYSKTFFFY